MVIPSFCVIKPDCFSNYCEMEVNYHGIWVTNVIKHNSIKMAVIYCGILDTKKQDKNYHSNLPQYFYHTSGAP
jgi:hypothetical protein